MIAYQFPTYAYALVSAVLAAAAIAMLTWRKRSAPGGIAFVLMMGATAVWTLFRVLEAVVVDVGAKIFWARFEYLGISSLPVLWYLFTREYARGAGSRASFGPIWLWLLPLATIGLVFGKPEWLWTKIEPASVEPGAHLVYTHGFAFWIAAGYSYLLLLAGALALLGAILQRQGVDRRQAIALLVGAILSWIANMAYLTGSGPVPGLDPTPFSFVLTGAIYAYTLYRYRLFDLVPVSRHALLENMDEGVLVLDVEKRISDINSAALRLLGLSGEGWIGRDVPALLRNWPQLLAYCSAQAETQGEIQVLGRYLQIRATPLAHPGHKPYGLLLVIRDISAHKLAEVALLEANDRLHAHVAEIEALQVKLQEQAIRDPLTGLFNRRYLEETLQRELARAARSGRPLGIVMIDVDYFKEVNDRHGHMAGDIALQALGRLLAANTRGGDVACRYGGEEFAIALPGATLEAAHDRAEQLRRAVEVMHVEYEGAALRLTISAGIAAYPTHGDRADQVLDNADKALYQAKTSGRNHCVVRAASGRSTHTS